MKYLPKASKATIKTADIDQSRQWIFNKGHFGIICNKAMSNSHKEILLKDHPLINTENLNKLLDLPFTAVKMNKLAELEPTNEALLVDNETIVQKFTYKKDDELLPVWLNRAYLSVIFGNVPTAVKLWVDPEQPKNRIYIIGAMSCMVYAVIMPIQK